MSIKRHNALFVLHIRLIGTDQLPMSFPGGVTRAGTASEKPRDTLLHSGSFPLVQETSFVPLRCASMLYHGAICSYDCVQVTSKEVGQVFEVQWPPMLPLRELPCSVV